MDRYPSHPVFPYARRRLIYVRNEYPSTREIKVIRPVNQIIHPAFEIRPGLILFRFVDRSYDDKTGKVEERRIYIGRGKRRPFKGIGPIQYEHNGAKLVIDSKYDYPPHLTDQWSRTDLDDFVANPGATIDAQTLFDELRSAVDRHVDLGHKGASCILAVWAALTFVYPIFPAVPFLLFLGAKQTGKSQALDVLAELCRCGHKSRSTAAALGDLIETQRVTPLLDQAGLLPDELLQVVIESYRRGATRTVTDVDKRGNPHRFKTFGPKAFAAHRGFDPDLLDRCILLPMAPATRSVEALLADDDRLERLRWQMYRFAIKNAAGLYRLPVFNDRTAVSERVGLDGRALELWWPLEVMFDWLDVPGHDREAAREFYRGSIPSTKAELDDCGREVLRALQALSDDGPLLEVSSDDVASAIKKAGGGGFGASRIGSRLRDLGLVLDRLRF